jgi:hypothetical protein
LLELTANELGQISNTASVTSGITDQALGNNSATQVTTVISEIHDLAVTKMRVPKAAVLKAPDFQRTLRVKVRIQNRSEHSEEVTDWEQLTDLVNVSVESLGSCPAPPLTLVDGKPNRPFVLKPKRFRNVVFAVTFNCPNDPMKNGRNDTGHEDYSFMAEVNHSALGTGADTSPDNDACPRPPKPETGDPGCGAKNPDKTLGAPVTTDVVVK